MRTHRDIFQAHQSSIDAWLEEKLAQVHTPFYTSVDIRDAGFKIAAIDSNLFPGGFNHLDPQEFEYYANTAKKRLAEANSATKTILIICENITHNIHYYENLYCLRKILVKAGYNVYLGTLLTHVTTSKTIPLPSGETITLYPIKKSDNVLFCDGKKVDLILLNNDLSTGIPEILINIKQPMMPSPQLGWHTRLKSQHFSRYQTLCQELAEHISIDPWLLSAEFRVCENFYFLSPDREEVLIEKTQDLLTTIQKKYDEYHIDKQPYAIIKSNHGTYGMAVMMVNSADQITKLKRRQRTQMSSAKGGTSVHNFIIQEGVYSIDTVLDNHIAEPVIYTIGKHILGGFYRYHSKRSQQENLNAPGMGFQSIPRDNVQYSQQVIAKLSIIAASLESAQATQPQTP